MSTMLNETLSQADWTATNERLAGEHPREILRWAVETNAKYIAMIGSKRKVIGVVKELEKVGIARAAFERVFAPMGLDIGAITPEEIAVSVVAEMIAVRRAPDSEWRSAAKSIFASEASRAVLK